MQHSKKDTLTRLSKNPLVASVRNDEGLDAVINCSAKVVFLGWTRIGSCFRGFHCPENLCLRHSHHPYQYDQTSQRTGTSDGLPNLSTGWRCPSAGAAEHYQQSSGLSGNASRHDALHRQAAHRLLFRPHYRGRVADHRNEYPGRTSGRSHRRQYNQPGSMGGSGIGSPRRISAQGLLP